jgi:predicted transcriptional regulator
MSTAMTLPIKFSARLEKLALEAGSTPEKILDFVMQDGFDYTENFVHQVKLGLADIEAGRVVSHEDAMIRLRSTVERHANKAA